MSEFLFNFSKDSFWWIKIEKTPLLKMNKAIKMNEVIGKICNGLKKVVS